MYIAGQPAAEKMKAEVVQPAQRRKTDYKPKEFVAGAGAAFTNICITFPINKIMFRQQLHGISVTKAIRQIHAEGFIHLYRGLTSPLLQKSASMAIMFGMFDHYKKVFAQSTNWSIYTQEICAAMIAGSFEAILCPFERLQVLMQDKKYNGHFKHTFEAAKEVRVYGYREYYRGFSCVILRNGPSNVAFFLCRTPIKNSFPEAKSQFGHVFQNFVSGAVLGASISTVFYPLNVIKTRMQCKLGGEFLGMYQTFKIVFNERDRMISKMYRGVHINFTRSLLSWGIINASYEYYSTLLDSSLS